MADCIYFAITARGERTIPLSRGETFPYHDNNNIIWIEQTTSNDSKASIRDTKGTWWQLQEIYQICKTKISKLRV